MLRIMHLSDLHIKKKYEKSGIESAFEENCFPLDALKSVLTKAEQLKVSIIVITGDLIHEGKKEDYQFLIKFIHEHSNIRCIGVLGNHDDPYEAFQVEAMKVFGVMDYCYEIDGYRFIAINSATEESEDGYYTEHQLIWLEELLKSKSEKGSILVCHHPIVWPTNMFRLEQEKELSSLLYDSDVRAVLCGHTHRNSTIQMDQQILQISSDSLLCGFDEIQEGLAYVSRTGYNLVDLDEENIRVYSERMNDSHEPFIINDFKSVSCLND